MEVEEINQLEYLSTSASHFNSPEKIETKKNSLSNCSTPLKNPHVSSSQSGRALLLKRFSHENNNNTETTSSPTVEQQQQWLWQHQDLDLDDHSKEYQLINERLENMELNDKSSRKLETPSKESNFLQKNIYDHKTIGGYFDDEPLISTLSSNSNSPHKRRFKRFHDENQHLLDISSLESKVRELTKQLSETESQVTKVQAQHKKKTQELELHIEDLNEQLKQSELEKLSWISKFKSVSSQKQKYRELINEASFYSNSGSQVDHNGLEEIGLEYPTLSSSSFDCQSGIISDDHEQKLITTLELKIFQLNTENDSLRQECSRLYQRVQESISMEEEFLFTQQKNQELETIIDQQESHIQELQNHIEELHQLHLESNPDLAVAVASGQELTSADIIKGMVKTIFSMTETNSKSEIIIENNNDSVHNIQTDNSENTISTSIASLATEIRVQEEQEQKQRINSHEKQQKQLQQTKSLSRQGSILLKRPPIRTFRTPNNKNRSTPNLSLVNTLSSSKSSIDCDPPLLFHTAPNPFVQLTPVKFTRDLHKKHQEYHYSSSSTFYLDEIDNDLDPHSDSDKSWGVGQVIGNLFKIFIPDSS